MKINSRYKRFLKGLYTPFLIILSVTLLRLAFPPYDIWGLSFVFLIPLLTAINYGTGTKILRLFLISSFSGWLFAFLGLYFMSYIWPRDFYIIQLVPAFMQGGKIFFAAIMAFSLTGLFNAGLVFISAWTLIDYLLLWKGSIMPFVIVGYPFSETFFGLKIAGNLGVCGISFFVLFTNLLLFTVFSFFYKKFFQDSSQKECYRAKDASIINFTFNSKGALVASGLIILFFTLILMAIPKAQKSNNSTIVWSKSKIFNKIKDYKSIAVKEQAQIKKLLEEKSKEHRFKRYLLFSLLQGNIDQHKKDNPLYRKEIGNIYFNLMNQTIREFKELEFSIKSSLNTRPHSLTKSSLKSLDSLDEPRVLKLIIWPETSSPEILRTDPKFFNRISFFCIQNSVSIVIGTRDFRQGYNTDTSCENIYYNSAVLIDEKGRWAQTCDKMIMTTFTETNNFKGFFSFMNRFRVIDHTVGRGEKPGFFKIGGFSFGALICYEALFPWFVKEQVDMGADFLVNISNDAWFNGTSEPEYLRQETAIRASEFNLPLLRASNSGISYAANSYDAEYTRLENMKRGFIIGIIGSVGSVQ